MRLREVAWTKDQIAEVERLFGGGHELHALAVLGSAELVSELESEVGPEYQLEALIQQMSSGAYGSGASRRSFDAAKSERLYGKLCVRHEARQLLRELKQDEDYLRHLERIKGS